MYRPNFPDRFPILIDGKLTMAGVVEKYWSEISKHWNNETAETYFRDYCEIIFPHFSEHPMEYFNDIRYFEEAIQAIRTSGVRRGKIRKRKNPQPYSASVTQHFRYLMLRVVQVGAEHHICYDVLWGTDFALSSNKSFKAVQNTIPKRLKKSFSAAEEYRIADTVFSNPLQSGQYMSLLLMWALGLRNTEACACVFGDILPIIDYSGWHILAVHCSMEHATHYIWGIGKTSSFYRFVPIPPNLYTFLMKRKEHIETEILEGNIYLPEGDPIQSVDDLPIACDHHNWLVHCTRNLASSAGRNLFKTIGFDEECMFLQAILPETHSCTPLLAFDTLSEMSPEPLLLLIHYLTNCFWRK